MDPDRVSVVYDIRRKLRRGHSEDIFQQFLTLGGYSAGAAILTFVLHLAMARILGPDSYAAYGTYVAIVFTVFFALNTFHLVITRFISYHRSRFQYEQINYIITASLKWLFISGFVLFGTILLLSEQISAFFGLTSIAPTVMLAFVLWFVLLIPVFEGAFKGLEDFRALGKFRLLEAALRLAFVVGLVWLGTEVAGAIFGLGMGTFLALTLSYRHLHEIQRLKEVRPNLRQIRRFAVPVALTMVSVSLLLNLDIILVKHYFSAEKAGLFAAASLIAKIPFLVAMVFVGIMFPKVTQLHADGKNSSPVLRNALQVVVPLAAVFTLLSFFLAGPLFRLLFGDAYTIGPVLGFYVFGMGALAITVLLATYLLAVKDDSIAFSLPLFVILLLGLLVIAHSTLLQVMIAVMLVMTGVLAFTVWKAREALDFDYFL